MSLFQRMFFTSHAGKSLDWKIECDELSEGDLMTLAFLISKQAPFSKVVGIPRGGLRLAKKLEQYVSQHQGKTLIVDDVLTTGKSMEEAREAHPDSFGVVIFARGYCPEWITPIFQLMMPEEPPTKEELLAHYGWEIQCESPFEICHSDGSFASGQAADYVVAGLREEED